MSELIADVHEKRGTTQIAGVALEEPEVIEVTA